jgi:excinuclease ABC subunit C
MQIPIQNLDFSTIPNAPGVYLFRSQEEEVLYVGKASNLRQRIRSYFHDEGEIRPAVHFLLKKSAFIEAIVTPDETEALLLEESLIKEHRPRYNIRLRDDKSYLYLRIRNDHPFPYLEIVRRPKETSFPTFGPYPSSSSLRQMVKTLLKFFPLRTCSNNKFSLRSRPCLDHQIGRCPAPCVGKITPEGYKVLVDSAIRFLKGDREKILQQIQKEMEKASEELRFEDAIVLRDQLKILEELDLRPAVVQFGKGSFDAWGFAEGERYLSAVVFHSVEGKVVYMDPFPRLPVGPREDYEQILLQYYGSYGLLPETILLPPRLKEILNLQSIASALEKKRGKVEIRFPQRGPEREVVEMAEENAKKLLSTSSSQDDLRGAEDLARLLSLPRVPEIVECYDISHFQGAEPVGVKIVFVRGFEDVRKRRVYRLSPFSSGIGDPQWMAEMLKRRLQKGVQEKDLPDLIVLDGGKAQLYAVLKVYEEMEIEWNQVPVIALAKPHSSWETNLPPEQKEERIYLPNRKNPVLLRKPRPAYLFLTQIRNASHKAVLGFHRYRLRSRLLLGLEQIPGMGPKRREILKKCFPNLKTILYTPVEEIQKKTRIPRKIVEEVIHFLSKKETAFQESLYGTETS